MELALGVILWLFIGALGGAIIVRLSNLDYQFSWDEDDLLFIACFSVGGPIMFGLATLFAILTGFVRLSRHAFKR